MKLSRLYSIRRPVVRTASGARICLVRALLIIGAVMAVLIAKPALAQNAFVQSNLVSNLPGLAAVKDTNLVNPWGLAFSATSPFWVADNGTGLSTLYNSTGAVQAVVVTVPPPAGQTNHSSPTGVIANSVPGFLATGTNT